MIISLFYMFWFSHTGLICIILLILRKVVKMQLDHLDLAQQFPVV